jgi:hypothetical protein
MRRRFSAVFLFPLSVSLITSPRRGKMDADKGKRSLSRLIFSREANFSFVFGLSTGTNWIKTKEKFASREKIRKWKTGFSRVLVR